MVAEQEGGDIRNEKGDVAEMVESKIQDQYDGQQQEEEGHQWLIVNAELFYADNGTVSSTDPDGFSQHSTR